LGDVVPSAKLIHRLVSEIRPGAIDYAIYRPVYPYYGAQAALGPDSVGRIRELLSADGPVAALLKDAGVAMVVPEASFVKPNQPLPATFSDEGLGCSWFGEVKPNGDMLVCSDRYGHPDYVIGNLLRSDSCSIWASDQRRQVFDTVRSGRCLRGFCPRNGRGFHFNRLFHQIERLRRAGRIDEVRRWVQDLRQIIEPPEHSFFL
jgi:hypothetical protein